MPYPPDGAFYEMHVIAKRSNESAITILKWFAPPVTHAALEAHRPNLRALREADQMRTVGASGAYKWLLAVDKEPAPMRVGLVVWRADGKIMTAAECVELERSMTAGRSPDKRRFVTIEPSSPPADLPATRRIFSQLQANRRAGRHWSRGLV
jgi:hypothetical protein